MAFIALRKIQNNMCSVFGLRPAQSPQQNFRVMVIKDARRDFTGFSTNSVGHRERMTHRTLGKQLRGKGLLAMTKPLCHLYGSELRTKDQRLQQKILPWLLWLKF